MEMSEFEKNHFRRQWQARSMQRGDGDPYDAKRDRALALAILFLGMAAIITIVGIFYAYSVSSPAYTPSDWKARPSSTRK